jgi:hypothetical protein
MRKQLSILILFASTAFITSCRKEVISNTQTPISVQHNSERCVDTCFTTPAIDDQYNIGWQYVDYVIPNGYRLDSVYADFQRPGYPPQDCDWFITLCPNQTSYIHGQANAIWSYQDTASSLYCRWIRLGHMNIQGTSTIRCYAPPTWTNLDWGNLCISASAGISFVPADTVVIPTNNVFGAVEDQME